MEKKVYIMRLCTIPEEVDDRTTWNGWRFLKKETGICLSNIYKIGVSVRPVERSGEICNIPNGINVLFQSKNTFYYLEYERKIHSAFSGKKYYPCTSIVYSGNSEFFRLTGCDVLFVICKLIDVKENAYIKQ